MIRKTKIVKSKKHLEWVGRNHVCIKCRSNYSVQACHIRRTDQTGNVGWGTKGGDSMIVPMCYLCHQLQHSMNEIKFWTCVMKLNPILIAYNLALKSPCKKIKQLTKEGHYDESIKYWDNLQASTKSTTQSEDL